jgi:hypothetical protein
MKAKTVIICGILLLLSVSSLQAGEMVLYAGSQKPGKLTFDEASELPGDLFEGGYGSTFGARFSGGKIIGFEQNLSFSPRFARSGVHAFQMDSNLLLQAPGKIVPYATAGLGFIVTWGQDTPDELNPVEIANYAFSMGKEFSFNYGGGLKLRRLLGPMGFNFDVRGYTIPSARDGSLNFIQMSLGAVFTF